MSGSRRALKYRCVKHFARIPKAFRCIFLHQAGRQRHAFGGRSEQSLELPQRNLPALNWSEVKGVAVADAEMSFAVAAAPGRVVIELADTLIESGDGFFAREFALGRWRPGTLIPAGKNQMRPFPPAGLRDSQ